MQKASTQVSMPQRAAISCTRAAPQLPHAPARRGACARACSSSSSAAGAPPSSSSSSDAPPAPRPLASRRAVLLSGAAAAAGGLLGARGAWAEQLQLLDESLASQLPGAAPPPADLPRAYSQTMRQLTKALREAIETEAGGAKENEVRRKADPAKDLAKQFIRKWQDNPQVAGDATHDEMRSALQELGQYYQRNGPRSRLTADAAASILGHLDAVEAALPADKKGLLGI